MLDEQLRKRNRLETFYHRSVNLTLHGLLLHLIINIRRAYLDILEHNGIVYKCVSAIIKRNKDGKPVYTAELTDRNNNSVSIVEPAKIKEVVL